MTALFTIFLSSMPVHIAFESSLDKSKARFDEYVKQANAKHDFYRRIPQGKDAQIGRWVVAYINNEHEKLVWTERIPDGISLTYRSKRLGWWVFEIQWEEIDRRMAYPITHCCHIAGSVVRFIEGEDFKIPVVKAMAATISFHMEDGHLFVSEPEDWDAIHTTAD